MRNMIVDTIELLKLQVFANNSGLNELVNSVKEGSLEFVDKDLLRQKTLELAGPEGWTDITERYTLSEEDKYEIMLHPAFKLVKGKGLPILTLSKKDFEAHGYPVHMDMGATIGPDGELALLITDINYPLHIVAGMIKHELVHIHQMRTGRLTHNPEVTGEFLWDGKVVEAHTTVSKGGITIDSQDEYSTTPWECQAYGLTTDAELMREGHIPLKTLKAWRDALVEML